MCLVWRVSGFDGAYELVWAGMGRSFAQASALSRPQLLPCFHANQQPGYRCDTPLLLPLIEALERTKKHYEAPSPRLKEDSTPTPC